MCYSDKMGSAPVKKLQVNLLSKTSIPPLKGRSGLPSFTIYTDESVEILEGTIESVGTGINMDMPDNCYSMRSFHPYLTKRQIKWRIMY